MWICCSRVQVFVVALRESGPLAHSIVLQSAATSPHEAQVCSDQSLLLVKLPGGGELQEVERVRPGASASRVTHTSHAFASGWTHVRSLVGPTPSACQQQPSCWQSPWVMLETAIPLVQLASVVKASCAERGNAQQPPRPLQPGEVSTQVQSSQPCVAAHLASQAATDATPVQSRTEGKFSTRVFGRSFHVVSAPEGGAQSRPPTFAQLGGPREAQAAWSV